MVHEIGTAEIGVTPEAKVQTIKDTNTSIKPTMKQLLVSAVSKEVRLPENEVTLSAYTVPAEQGNQHYNYAWSLLSQPEGHTGTMTDQNRITVKLSNLSEGLYTFKVAVSSPNAYGEAYANVSVLPRECFLCLFPFITKIHNSNYYSNSYFFSKTHQSSTYCHNYSCFSNCETTKYRRGLRWLE